MPLQSRIDILAPRHGISFSWGFKIWSELLFGWKWKLVGFASTNLVRSSKRKLPECHSGDETILSRDIGRSTRSLGHSYLIFEKCENGILLALFHLMVEISTNLNNRKELKLAASALLFSLCLSILGRSKATIPSQISHLIATKSVVTQHIARSRHGILQFLHRIH